MKKFKRVLSIIIGIMLVTALAGCGGDNSGSDKEVTLRWVLMGDKMEDTDKVFAAFNEALKTKLPNTQVEFDLIPAADYLEKWQLIMSAGESVDLAWHGWMQDHEEEVRRGAYLELSDLIEKYGQDYKKAVPEFAWEGQMVDGKLYYMPNVQMMVDLNLHLFTSEDKANKYLDRAALDQALANSYNREVTGETVVPAWSDEVWDVIEDYLANLKEAGRLGLGLNSKELLSWLAPVKAQEVFGQVCYVVQDASGRYIAKPIQTADSPYRKDFERMADFYQKGYIRKDIQTATTSTIDEDPEQGYVFTCGGGDEFSSQMKSLEAGQPVMAIDTFAGLRGYKKFDDVTGTNTTIPATSKNPERAMQLYNLLYTEEGRELMNILSYGIEGEHYEKTGENSIKTFEPVKHSIYPWVIGDSLSVYETQDSVPGYNDYVKNVLNNPDNVDKTEDPFKDFKFDETPVKNIMVQIKSVLDEYKDLDLGSSANWEQRCSEMEDRLKKIGIDKVVAELQKQLDEKVNQ